MPSFLHRSALAHLHHAVSVGIKFFELAHRLLVGYASQRNAAAVRRRSNERPELASQRLSATAFWAPCGTAEHPAATHEALKVCSGVLDQLDALWSSCSLTTRIFESWNVQWILRNGKNESGSQQQLLTLKKLRLQVLCIALGIQCFDNSTSNSKHILTLVTQDFCYCLPPFLLMLFGATRCRIPLVATFANVSTVYTVRCHCACCSPRLSLNKNHSAKKRLIFYTSPPRQRGVHTLMLSLPRLNTTASHYMTHSWCSVKTAYLQTLESHIYSVGHLFTCIHMAPLRTHPIFCR